MANLINLKTIRDARAYTQDELAALAGVSPAAIRKHEQGAYKDSKLSLAIALSHALCVSIEDLFSPNFSHKTITQEES